MRKRSRLTVFLLCIAMLSFPFWDGSEDHSAISQNQCDVNSCAFCALCSENLRYWKTENCYFDFCVEVLAVYGDCSNYCYCVGCWGMPGWYCVDTCA